MDIQNFARVEHQLDVIRKYYDGIVEDSETEKRKELIELGFDGYVKKWFNKLPNGSYVFNDASVGQILLNIDRLNNLSDKELEEYSSCIIRCE